MRLVVERGGLGFMVWLLTATFVATVNAVVGASTPEPLTAQKHGFFTKEIR